MKGLILKDLFLIRRTYGKIAVFLTILYIAMALLLKDGSTFFLFGTVWIMLFGLMSVATFSCDKAAHWDRFALSTPAGRSSVVMGKYLLSILLLLAGSAFALLYLIFTGLISGSVDMAGYFFAVALNCCCMALLVAVLLPLVFRFGAEKARFLILVVAFAATALSGVLSNLADTGAAGFGPAGGLPLILALAAALMLAVSYYVSLGIYARKEID